MIDRWNEDITDFITAATQHGVRMLMVGGAAVNFYGYQRHSTDVDFWLEITPKNLENLLSALQFMGYEITNFPAAVIHQEQNISLKFSPVAEDVELITNFSVNKDFDTAYNESDVAQKGALEWRVISFDDLIMSKVKASRPKDILDIQELQRIRNSK